MNLPTEDSRRYLYQIFGISLQSSISFSFPQSIEQTNIDLEFNYFEVEPDWDLQNELLYSSPLRDAKGQSRFQLFRLENGLFFSSPGGIGFAIYPEMIICKSPKFNLMQIEHFLFGIVLALWLETRGTIALHASAVEIDGQVAGFLASSRSGKSTLAASFLLTGSSFVTDNILPVIQNNQALSGYPGFPGLRLMPEEGKKILQGCDGVKTYFSYNRKLTIPIGGSGFGHYHHKDFLIACIYLPTRYQPNKFRSQDQGLTDFLIQITPLSKRDAVIELMRYSFLTHVLDAVGLAPGRLGKLAQIAQVVPIRRLRYPNGFEYLAKVRAAVTTDLAAIRHDPINPA